MISETPEPPYYAVIFSSVRTEQDAEYSEVATRMVELAQNQRGFLGVESAREELGITVSYWKDEESIKAWRDNAEHTIARNMGKEKWYAAFKVRVAKVERDYGFRK